MGGTVGPPHRTSRMIPLESDTLTVPTLANHTGRFRKWGQFPMNLENP